MRGHSWTLLAMVVGVPSVSTPSPAMSAWNFDTLAERARSVCTLKSSLPEQNICGLNGRLELSHKGPFHIFASPQLVETINDCRNLCANRARPNKRPNNSATSDHKFDVCKGFSYNSVSNLCKLYPFFPAQNFTQVGSSQDTFYQFECYDCPQTCPTTGNANLLDNPGFEMSRKYIGPWFLRPQAELVQTSGGNAVFCPAGGKCLLKQYRRLCLNQRYIFTMDMKVVSDSASSKLPMSSIFVLIGDLAQEVQIDWLKEFNNPSGYFTITSTFLDNQDVVGYLFKAHDEATAAHVNILPQADTRMSTRDVSDTAGVEKRAKQPGVYLDNFSIVSSPRTFETQGPSLLENGGFETGKMAPWRFDYFITDDYGKPGKHGITSPGISGNFAFQRDSSETSGFWLKHPIVTLLKGKQYLLSYDFTTSKEAKVGRDFRPAAKIFYPQANESQEWGFYLEDAPREYSPFRRAFVALADEAQVTVTIYPSFYACFAKPNVCKNVIDNIELRELADGTT